MDIMQNSYIYLKRLWEALDNLLSENLMWYLKRSITETGVYLPSSQTPCS